MKAQLKSACTNLRADALTRAKRCAKNDQTEWVIRFARAADIIKKLTPGERKKLDHILVLRGHSKLPEVFA